MNTNTDTNTNPNIAKTVPMNQTPYWNWYKAFADTDNAWGFGIFTGAQINVLNNVAKGANVAAAAGASGLHRTTVYYWARSSKSFAMALQHARKIARENRGKRYVAAKQNDLVDLRQAIGTEQAEIRDRLCALRRAYNRMVQLEEDNAILLLLN